MKKNSILTSVNAYYVGNDNKLYPVSIIGYDTTDTHMPFLVSFGKMAENAPDNIKWRISERDAEIFSTMKDVMSTHIGQLASWARAEDLRSRGEDDQEHDTEENNMSETTTNETATNEKDERTERQIQLVKLMLENMIDNAHKGLDSGFKDLSNRSCTRTSLHHQIVLLRYQLRELDKLIDSYPMY